MEIVTRGQIWCIRWFNGGIGQFFSLKFGHVCSLFVCPEFWSFLTDFLMYMIQYRHYFGINSWTNYKDGNTNEQCDFEKLWVVKIIISTRYYCVQNVSIPSTIEYFIHVFNKKLEIRRQTNTYKTYVFHYHNFKHLYE